MKRKELLIIAIAIFLTVIAMLAADIYHVYTEEQLNQKVATPQLIDYQVDQELLDILEQKQN